MTKKKTPKDQRWPRIRFMAKLAPNVRTFFAENARLFVNSMEDRDDTDFHFVETFLAYSPEAVLVPQVINEDKLHSDQYRQLHSAKPNEPPTHEIDLDENGCVSPLGVAMLLFNKEAVEDCVTALLKILNRPLNKEQGDYFDQFYPSALRVNKKDLTKLANKFPGEFIRLITGIKLQRSYPLVKNKLKRCFEQGQFEVKGVSSNADLVDLWAPEEEQEDEQWVTPMVINLPEVATFEMLKAYITVSKGILCTYLFRLSVVVGLPSAG